MKVQGLTDLIRSMQRLNGGAAADKDKDGQGNEYSRQQRRQKDSDHGQKQSPVEKEQDEFKRLLELRQKIDAEIERFAREEVSRTNGIRAQREGEGPGLKVCLKDAGGAVIRRMSGEEFLQIRSQGAAPAIAGRGRLLDRKL
jgi:hypothetical protein